MIVTLRFRCERKQKVCNIGGIKVGGQPGENPPLLLASLFQKGDQLVESRKNRKLDRKGATERNKEMEEISDQTGVPGIVAMVANSPEEMKAVEAALERAREILSEGDCSLLVLDDINSSLNEGTVHESMIKELIAQPPVTTTIVLTGRSAPQWALNLASIATYFAEVKHPVHQGDRAPQRHRILVGTAVCRSPRWMVRSSALAAMSAPLPATLAGDRR